ncbi:hypothetical protein ACFLSJ_07170 [Verrucomicrobiota bacterium]
MRAFHSKTVALIDAARSALERDAPMTVRQLFYRLVATQVIDNSDAQYNRVSRVLCEARKAGLVPWEWIEDRLRRPRHVSMWYDPADFAAAVAASYRKNVWEQQETYLEVWLEKDALSAVFEDTLSRYGVTLNVGRGYDSTTSVHDAAERWRDKGDVTVLHFGDFDPSGEDMVRSLRERLAGFESCPEIVKVALTPEDIERHSLPPNPTKKQDRRSAKFVARYGDRCVELDALPPGVLKDRLRREIEARLDMDTMRDVWDAERKECDRMVAALERCEEVA